MMIKMVHQQLLALITDVDRLITAGAESIAEHEGLAAHTHALHQLGRQVPALKSLLPLMEAVRTAPKAERSDRLLNLQSRIRHLRATLAAPADLEGEIVPIGASGPWHTSTPLKELVIEVGKVRSSRAHRQRVAKGLEQCLTDLRMVGALMEMVENGEARLADAIADEVLPRLGRMIVPELTRLPFHKENLGDLRRLAALCNLDPQAGHAAVCRLDPELAEHLSASL